MFKRTMFKWGTKRYLKRSKPDRETIPFQEAKSIGIVIGEESEHVNRFIQKLTEQGKAVTVLQYEQNKKQKSRFPTVSFKDLKWNGAIRNLDVKKFIRTEFDYLFSLNTSPILLVENILARSKAKCRVGSFPERSDNYELVINTGKSNNIKELSEQMLLYTQMIKQ